MATIKEDYVSFEIAKLLKEKGFKGQGEHFYENGKIIGYINYWDRITPKQRYEAIEAPTLQMAMKWLREVHHIHIRLINSSDESYKYEIYPREGKYRSSCFSDRCYYETYEKAAEAAIKYCLNLI